MVSQLMWMLCHGFHLQCKHQTFLLRFFDCFSLLLFITGIYFIDVLNEKLNQLVFRMVFCLHQKLIEVKSNEGIKYKRKVKKRIGFDRVEPFLADKYLLEWVLVVAHSKRVKNNLTQFKGHFQEKESWFVIDKQWTWSTPKKQNHFQLILWCYSTSVSKNILRLYDSIQIYIKWPLRVRKTTQNKQCHNVCWCFPFKKEKNRFYLQYESEKRKENNRKNFQFNLQLP